MSFLKALHNFLNSPLMRIAGTASAALAGYVATQAATGSTLQMLAIGLGSALGALGLSAKPDAAPPQEEVTK